MKFGRLLTGLLWRLRRVPALFGRFRVWAVLILFVVLLGALSPFVGALSGLLNTVLRLVAPVLESRVGRTVLGVGALFLVGLWLYRRFRVKGRALLGAYALDQYLAGMMHLSAGRCRRAARHFERVLRTNRLVDLERTVEVYPEIAADARIRLALCHREQGDIERAMEHLELVKVKDLAPAMRRDHAEAKALVYSLSRELMDETVDREIDRALEGDPDNRRLWRLKRERAEGVGDLPAAIAAQRALLRAAPAHRKSAERSRLALLHARNALRLRRLEQDEEALAEVARARSLDPGLPLASLVAGDIAADRGDARLAVREYGQAPSRAGLDRIRALLAAGRIEGGGTASCVAESFPRAGVFLALAEHYLRKGKPRRARNCLAKLAELGAFDRHAAHLLAEVLRREGDAAGAERMEWRAMRGFLGGDGEGAAP